MGHIKSFMLGVAVAFGFYCITKKGRDGNSILDDVLDNPHYFMHKAKDYAIAEVISTLKNKIK